MICQRRIEDGRAKDGTDEWIEREGYLGCSYCGSLHPDKLMEMIKDGSAIITPTDKNYKIYVDAEPQSPFLKFYFQHLSEEQQKEFVDMMNAKTIRFKNPGYFYVLPFFAAKGDAA